MTFLALVSPRRQKHMNHHLQAPSPLLHRGFVTIIKQSLDGIGGFVIIEESLDDGINEEKRREPLALSAEFLRNVETWIANTEENHYYTKADCGSHQPDFRSTSL